MEWIRAEDKIKTTGREVVDIVELLKACKWKKVNKL